MRMDVAFPVDSELCDTVQQSSFYVIIIVQSKQYLYSVCMFVPSGLCPRVHCPSKPLQLDSLTNNTWHFLPVAVVLTLVTLLEIGSTIVYNVKNWENGSE
jgi:hypothetical protein